MTKALSLTTKKNLPPRGDGFSLIAVENEFEQNYKLYRINLPPIEIESGMRDFVEQAMGSSKKFVRVGDHTIMVNSIAGIDPLKKKYKPAFFPKHEQKEQKPMTDEEKLEYAENAKKLEENKDKLRRKFLIK